MFISNRLKSFILIFISIIITSSLIGCSADNEKNDIYDDNERIAQAGDSFSFYKRIGETSDKKADLKYSRFSGVQTIWAIETDGNSDINITYDSLVSSGKFKVVLVTPDKEVINIVEQSGKDTHNYVTIKGRYSIKFVGLNANGNIQIDLSTLAGTKN